MLAQGFLAAVYDEGGGKAVVVFGYAHGFEAVAVGTVLYDGCAEPCV